MNVVIVESPTKAKTIGKYLGPDFTILASYGHVRDLPPKDGSVKPDNDFAMYWQVDPKGDKQIKAMARALQSADQLYLATDPDREGEAISWHIWQELKRRKALDHITVNRVIFHEVTREAIQRSMKEPRELNQDLVDAYLARRALDYLVGFTLSPVLWRKLPGSRSAGRVQSVCLRLICEREAEIELFRKQEYWSIEGDFTNTQGHLFRGKLSHLDGQKIDKMQLTTETQAHDIAKQVARFSYTVGDVQRKVQKRHPRPPFTTSTLQQEASHKLGFSASQTMRLAQKLFEGVEVGGETVGLISYMRTDSVALSSEAIATARKAIQAHFSSRYLPASPRRYKTTAKNTQEAHEAIRPTDSERYIPGKIAGYLGENESKLYDLIWRRTLASQMESADIEQTSVDLVTADKQTIFHTSGTVILFDGFLTLYQEGPDQTQNGEKSNTEKPNTEKPDKKTEILLPQLATGDKTPLKEIHSLQHFTQPPPRYNEASLVKKMEELGIGRPSTYASIIDVLQSRNYVTLEKKRFIPQDRGRIVTAFLENFFSRYVQYDFTARLEDQLDDISNSRENWRHVLRAFWSAFIEAIGTAKELSVREVIDALDADLGTHFFPQPVATNETSSPVDPRRCPACSTGRLSLKLSKIGGFIGCSNYPDCRYTRGLSAHEDDAPPANDTKKEARILGDDPQTGLPVKIQKGPYGFYLQLGEGEKGKKPKRASLSKTLSPESVTLETALSLLSLPREIGHHPETGHLITAGIGPYGPYIHHQKKYISLRGDDDVLTIGINRAVDLLAQKIRPADGQLLGKHPKDGKPVTLKSGRYGPYVSHGKLNASLPKHRQSDEVDLETALALLEAKAQKSAS